MEISSCGHLFCIFCGHTLCCTIRAFSALKCLGIGLLFPVVLDENMNVVNQSTLFI